MIASSGAAAIPNRTVDIADARELSVRLTHYSLTAAAAENEESQEWREKDADDESETAQTKEKNEDDDKR